MNKLTLTTGSDGMVGSRFVELYPKEDQLHLPSEVEMDITDTSRVSEVLNKYKFGTVINFAAFTDVNAAEKQRYDKTGSCWQINVEGVKNLVDSINPNDTHFIQISTDMVFTGLENDPGPYTEDTPLEQDIEKLTWYGYTKVEADRYVMEKLGDKYTIVRIMYPVRSNYEQKTDYLRGPLQLYDQGKLYPLINDQQVTISFIDEIADVLTKIINEKIYGTYHVSSTNTGTPYEIISYMLKQVRGVDPSTIERTTLDHYLKKSGNSKYRYPKHGGLSVDKSQSVLEIKFNTWQETVRVLTAQGLGR